MVLVRRVVPLLVTVLLAGCGSSPRSAPVPPGERTTSTSAPAPGTGGKRCLVQVTTQLGEVARRAYGEAEASDTVRTAVRLMQSSAPLATAVARQDPRAARRALRALEATGHLARVRVMVAGRVLADVGPRDALAPHSLSLGGATVTFSVQTPVGLVQTVRGLTSTHVIVRAGRRLLAGRSAGIPRSLPVSGTALRGALGAYSFPARAFDGRALQVTVLHSAAASQAVCGASAPATTANVLAFLGSRIYQEETNGHAVAVQRARVSADPALGQAVRAGDTAATGAAVRALLNQHIVRLRVLAPGGRLLADVGGPHVLAPVSGSLAGGGSFLLSVQDDLGYLLLSHRLLGAEVLIRSNARQILSTMATPPPSVPDRGTVDYAGRRYAAWSFHAAAFPAGSIRISLLLPLA